MLNHLLIIFCEFVKKNEKDQRDVTVRTYTNVIDSNKLENDREGMIDELLEEIINHSKDNKIVTLGIR